MTALTYTARSSLFSREATYGLDDANLSDEDGRVVPLSDVVRVRTHTARRAPSWPGVAPSSTSRSSAASCIFATAPTSPSPAGASLG